MPVVLLPLREPRPPLGPQAGLAVPRRTAGSRAEDCHQLDPRRWSEPAVSALLHDGRRRRQEGREDRRPLGLRGGQAFGCQSNEAHPGDRRHADPALWTVCPWGGIHHNPTPGPAGSPHVYGHIWVVLGLLAVHPAWGVIAVPLLARMYVRVKDLLAIYPQHRPEFQTKLEMAVEVLQWAHFWLRHLCKPLCVVVDGAYAKAPFLKPAMALGMTVVSRLRKDAALWTVPGPRVAGRPGRPRIYGENRHPSGSSTSTTRIGPPAGRQERPVSLLRLLAIEPEDGGHPAATLPGTLGQLDGLLLHRRECERGRDPRDRRRSVRAGDHLPRLQGDRRGRLAAGAIRVGKHRCISYMPLDVHDD